MKRPFTILSSKVAWECPWYHIRQDRLSLPHGGEATYNVVTRPSGAVVIVPLLATGELMLIRHYRHTVGEWVWEVPAGGIEEGQSAAAAAAIELTEEIGGTAARLDPIGEFFTAVGFCDEKCHIFLAADVVLGATSREPLEYMEMVPTDPEVAFEMARDGTIKDSLSALAILWAEERIRAKTDKR